MYMCPYFGLGAQCEYEFCSQRLLWVCVEDEPRSFMSHEGNIWTPECSVAWQREQTWLLQCNKQNAKRAQIKKPLETKECFSYQRKRAYS